MKSYPETRSPLRCLKGASCIGQPMLSSTHLNPAHPTGSRHLARTVPS